MSTFETGGNASIINMSEVEAIEYKPLAAGIYQGTVSKAEYKIASSGSSMWSIVFDVIVEENGKQITRKLFDNLVFKQTALAYVKPKLQILAPELAGKADLNPETDYEILLGRSARLRVAVGEYNGQPNNNIQGYLPATDTF